MENKHFALPDCIKQKHLLFNKNIFSADDMLFNIIWSFPKNVHIRKNSQSDIEIINEKRNISMQNYVTKNRGWMRIIWEKTLQMESKF